MTDLLLITDVPRLRQIFSLLSDEKHVRLRVATDLENGAEELLADKPAMVFVQNHLSGLNAEILLMHLKKQLGRRRTRFVLLSSLDQVEDEVLKLYHAHIDTALDDNVLFQEARELVAGLSNKSRKDNRTAEPATTKPAAVVETAPPVGDTQPTEIQSAVAVISVAPEGAPEPSLVEQGVVYSRSPLSVYSEFTSSFDNAVSSMAPEEPPATEATVETLHDWNYENAEIIVAEQPRSRFGTFLLWSAPVLVAVIIVTVLQNRTPAKKADPALTPTPNATAAIQAASPVAVATPVPVAAPSVSSATKAAAPPAAESDARMSDQALLAAIAESRKPAAPPKSPRPTELPAFIPRSGLDKAYGAANPGWERYKGQVTEFKIFREGTSIKALQIIDRGGKGVPESFIKGALGQLVNAPAFVMASSEKKEGYEIQRGQIAEGLKAVFYRDAGGGSLRALVLTWQ